MPYHVASGSLRPLYGDIFLLLWHGMADKGRIFIHAHALKYSWPFVWRLALQKFTIAETYTDLEIRKNREKRFVSVPLMWEVIERLQSESLLSFKCSHWWIIMTSFMHVMPRSHGARRPLKLCYLFMSTQGCLPHGDEARISDTFGLASIHSLKTCSAVGLHVQHISSFTTKGAAKGMIWMFKNRKER